MDPEELAIYSRSAAACPGWSDLRHAVFFRNLVELRPERILMLGVYAGRDISLLLQFARRGDLRLHVDGVDLFSPEPCADWPDEAKRNRWTWEQFCHLSAPTWEAATENVGQFVARHRQTCTLHKERDAVWCADMAQAYAGTYDAIYVDTSHDRETVRTGILAALPLLSPNGVICGDDHTSQGTWGVPEACRSIFTQYGVAFGWIWFATQAERKILP